MIRYEDVRLQPWGNVGSQEGVCSLLCFRLVKDLNILKSQGRDLLVMREVEYLWGEKRIMDNIRSI